MRSYKLIINIYRCTFSNWKIRIALRKDIDDGDEFNFKSKKNMKLNRSNSPKEEIWKKLCGDSNIDILLLHIWHNHSRYPYDEKMRMHIKLERKKNCIYNTQCNAMIRLNEVATYIKKKKRIKVIPFRNKINNRQ